jgi:hypothetical protein
MAVQFLGRPLHDKQGEIHLPVIDWEHHSAGDAYYYGTAHCGNCGKKYTFKYHRTQDGPSDYQEVKDNETSFFHTKFNAKYPTLSNEKLPEKKWWIKHSKILSKIFFIGGCVLLIIVLTRMGVKLLPLRT